MITNILISPSISRDLILFIQIIFKNKAGGLAHRKIKPEQVIHYSNATDPICCFVRLYEINLQHCPTDTKMPALYLTPLKKI